MDSEMDAVLSSIKSTWDRSVILTGDTNIDLLSSSTARHIYKKMPIPISSTHLHHQPFSHLSL